MTDDELIGFVWWCRLNEARIVLDPVVTRRVLAAYDGSSVPDEVDQGEVTE